MPQGYIRPALNLHSRNLTTAMQDPDGTAAFCHHHNSMTNVSFNSPKLEEKYRPSCKNELMLQMNKISFAEDNLDSMTTKCQDFMYEELLLDFAMTLGCPWYDICFYCKGQTCNPNRYKSLFSLAYSFPLMCKTLHFYVKLCKCLRTGVKTVWYDLVQISYSSTFLI